MRKYPSPSNGRIGCAQKHAWLEGNLFSQRAAVFLRRRVFKYSRKTDMGLSLLADLCN